jgi:hypothetical protein
MGPRKARPDGDEPGIHTREGDAVRRQAHDLWRLKVIVEA